jgi:hypothetical protein
VKSVIVAMVRKVIVLGDFEQVMVATDWDGVSELAQLAIVLFQSSSKQTGFGSRPSLADGRIETQEQV